MTHTFDATRWMEHRAMVQSCLLVLLFVFSTCLCVQAQADGRTGPAGDEPDDSSIISEVPVEISAKFLDALRSSKTGAKIRIPMGNGKSIAAVTRDIDSLPRGFIWSGSIPGRGVGIVTLAVADGSLSGAILYNARLFRINTVEPTRYVIREIDANRLPEIEGPDSPSPGADDRVVRKAGPRLTKAVAKRFEDLTKVRESLLTYGLGDLADMVLTLLPDDGSQVDVMVLYTDAAAAFLNDKGVSVVPHFYYQIGRARDIYLSSGVNARLNLVHVERVNYRATDYKLEGDLAALRDGHIANVRSLRNTHRADLVVMFVNNDLGVPVDAKRRCGNATTLRDLALPGQDPSPHDGRGLFADFGYSVVSIHCAWDGFTLPHELAHNFGAHHDVYAVEKENSAGGLFGYSHGFVLLGREVRTIMSYPYFCADVAQIECPVIGALSNPQRSYLGYPLGINPSPNPVLNLDASDNVRTINESTWTVANFRNSNFVLP